MITPFRTTTSGLTAQPSTEKLIIRSTSATDTSQTLTVSGTVSAAPDTEAFSLLGKREVEGAKTFTALVAALLSGTAAGTVTVRGQGTKGEGRIIFTENPVDGDTVSLGLAGFAQTYTFKDTLTGAANEVKIGAAASDTAANLDKAINDSGTEGTHYGTGTAANAFLSSTVSGTILTVTDRLACDRQLDWSFTQSGTALSLSTPIGGVDGALLVTVTAGDTARTGAISLDDEALVLGAVPPLTTFVSDWLRTGGKNCTLYLAAGSVASPLSVSYEIATDTGYPVAGATSLTGLDNNRYAATPEEAGIEYIRLSVTNPNAAPVSVNAKVVTG